MARREIDVELGVGGVADLRGRILSGERGEMRGGGEDQGLIGGLVVSGRLGPGGGSGRGSRYAIEEFDDVGGIEVGGMEVGGMEDVLIEAGEQENFVALEWAADSASELLLAIVGLERQQTISRAKGAISHVVEDGAVDVIEPDLVTTLMTAPPERPCSAP